MEIIPLTRAKATLSEIVARLLYRKETIVITRKRVPVAAIVPYEQWALKESAAKDGLAAAAGALADLDAEIDELVEAAYAARAGAKDRPVRL